MMFNPTEKSRLFYLPPTPHQQIWRLAIDTGLPQPLDIRPEQESENLRVSSVYLVKAHSMVVMFSTWQRPGLPEA
jgi:hypothetical protein